MIDIISLPCSCFKVIDGGLQQLINLEEAHSLAIQVPREQPQQSVDFVDLVQSVHYSSFVCQPRQTPLAPLSTLTLQRERAGGN